MTLSRGQFAQTRAPSPGSKTGGQAVVQQAAVNGTGNVTISGSIPAGTNVIGHVVVDSGTVTVNGTVTANPTGSTPVLANALSTTVKSVVSSVAATLDSVTVLNPNTTIAYVQIFDIATSGAVNLGTTVPKWSIGLGIGQTLSLTGLKLGFASGIQVAATTTATGLTALSVAVDANFGIH